MQAGPQAPRLETTSQRVIDRLTALDAPFEELLLEHSAIEPPEPSPHLVWIGPESWMPLSPEGRHVQGRIRRELDVLAPLVTTLVHDAPADVRDGVAEALPILRDAADQSKARTRLRRSTSSTM